MRYQFLFKHIHTDQVVAGGGVFHKFKRIPALEMNPIGIAVFFGKPNDFGIMTPDKLIGNFRAITGGITLAMIFISSIALLVGGVGVMNIMLVSVTERTREIGIRMATGARMRDILQQFLGEALTVSALGGLIGVAGGLGVAAAIGALGTPVVFSPGPVLLAFGCAFATGLVFGYMPARKAARLDPVVALAAE